MLLGISPELILDSAPKSPGQVTVPEIREECQWLDQASLFFVLFPTAGGVGVFSSRGQLVHRSFGLELAFSWGKREGTPFWFRWLMKLRMLHQIHYRDMGVVRFRFEARAVDRHWALLMTGCSLARIQNVFQLIKWHQTLFLAPS